MQTQHQWAPRVSMFHFFLFSMKFPVTQETRFMENKEAMCPRDWAEKIFCLTRWLEILPRACRATRFTCVVWCYCKKSGLLCFTIPGLCQSTGQQKGTGRVQPVNTHIQTAFTYYRISDHLEVRIPVCGNYVKACGNNSKETLSHISRQQ